MSLNVSCSPYVKEPVVKGHLSRGDTFYGILQCLLMTGSTVEQITFFNKQKITLYIISHSPPDINRVIPST